MALSAKQVRALRRQPDHRHIRTREAHGRELSYLEGWYSISEANRIFGFDGWNRETIESKCVLARENRGTFLAVYIARVRVTVHADGATIIREGHGTGEGQERHRARCTISPSRSRKPTPPNGRWRPSESRSVLSSIGVARQPQYPRSPCPHRLLSLRLLSLGLLFPCPPMPISASTQTIRPLFHGHPATMAVARIWSLGIGRRVAVNWKAARPPAARLLCRPHLASSQGKSTKAFSPSPNRSGCVTKPI